MTANDQTRRTFLKLLGTGVVAIAFPSGFKAAPAMRKPRIGLQLYSVRSRLETGFDQAIKTVADIGFAGVELYALPPGVTPEHARGVLRENGLEILGMHAELPVGDARDHVLELTDVFECQRIIYAGWPEGEKYKTLDAIRRTADRYNETAGFLAAKGLRFGLHNHWWEFEERDGVIPFYYLLEHLDREIFFEIDTYWAKAAGADPVQVVGDFGSRAPLLHIKDGRGIRGPEGNMQVPAGEGMLDIPGILATGGEHTEWAIVEFDEYAGDIFEGIRRSHDYLLTKGLAAERT